MFRYSTARINGAKTGIHPHLLYLKVLSVFVQFIQAGWHRFIQVSQLFHLPMVEIIKTGKLETCGPSPYANPQLFAQHFNHLDTMVLCWVVNTVQTFQPVLSMCLYCIGTLRVWQSVHSAPLGPCVFDGWGWLWVWIPAPAALLYCIVCLQSTGSEHNIWWGGKKGRKEIN